MTGLDTPVQQQAHYQTPLVQLLVDSPDEITVNSVVGLPPHKVGGKREMADDDIFTRPTRASAGRSVSGQ